MVIEMTIGKVVAIFGVFTTIISAGVAIQDSRAQDRFRNFELEQKITLDAAVDTISNRNNISIKKEVSKYDNIFTLEEFVDMSSSETEESLLIMKKFIVSENRKSEKKLSNHIAEIELERELYREIPFVSWNGEKYLHTVIERHDSIIFIRETKVDKFDYEK